jgi:hypothetical protein
MEILLIIMLAPLVLALGVGLVRLMVSPVFWCVALSWGTALLLLTMAHS